MFCQIISYHELSCCVHQRTDNCFICISLPLGKFPEVEWPCHMVDVHSNFSRHAMLCLCWFIIPPTVYLCLFLHNVCVPPIDICVSSRSIIIIIIFYFQRLFFIVYIQTCVFLFFVFLVFFFAYCCSVWSVCMYLQKHHSSLGLVKFVSNFPVPAGKVSRRPHYLGFFFYRSQEVTEHIPAFFQ